MGLSMADLDDLDMGMILDMMVERSRDNSEDSVKKATQEDMNKF